MLLFNSYYHRGHVCRIRGVFDLCVKFLRRDFFCLWLQQKGDEGEEGVTSEGRVTWMSLNYQLHLSFLFNFLFHPPLSEFDKFLEERAKAAEMTPGLPSPPTGEPGVSQGTPNRKKPETPEERLLAM